MSDVTVKRVTDLEYYTGDQKVEGIQYRYASELGVTGFGLHVLDMDAGCDQYVEHDHADSGIENVYLLLRGSAILKVGIQDHVLEQGVLARVGAGEKRKITAGVDGATVLVLAGTPGKPYPAKQ